MPSLHKNSGNEYLVHTEPNVVTTDTAWGFWRKQDTEPEPQQPSKTEHPSNSEQSMNAMQQKIQDLETTNQALKAKNQDLKAKKHFLKTDRLTF
jgi:hypothetical protein